MVAPEIGEEHEARLLAAEEERAARRASFTLVDDGHGSCHGRFTLPSLTGRMLRQHLLALANPRRSPGEPDAPDTPSTTRHPWGRGGHTTVTGGRLLCPRHHRLAHHDDYEMP